MSGDHHSFQRLTLELREDKIAVITLNDGKANAMSTAMLLEINRALDLVEQAGMEALVLTSGRPTIFCGGFDLNTIKNQASVPSANPEENEALRMIRGGFELLARLYTFPILFLVAVNGHAYALGLFLLLAADFRIALDDPAAPLRVAANEVAIGLTLPEMGVRIFQDRVHPRYAQRMLLLAEALTPALALDAGIFDLLVQTKSDLLPVTLAAAQRYKSTLNLQALAASKVVLRSEALLQDIVQKDVKRVITSTPSSRL